MSKENEELKELPDSIIKAREEFMEGAVFEKKDQELKEILRILVKEGIQNERVRHFPNVMATSIHYIQLERLIAKLNTENSKTQKKFKGLMIIGVVIAFLQLVIAIILLYKT